MMTGVIKVFHRPKARRVELSMRPVAFRLWSRWKAITAARVFSPKMPSIAPGEKPLPSNRICSVMTCGPKSPIANSSTIPVPNASAGLISTRKVLSSIPSTQRWPRWRTNFLELLCAARVETEKVDQPKRRTIPNKRRGENPFVTLSVGG